MLKFIYCSDLHGNKDFYRRLLWKAEEDKLDVIIGGDLCPRIEGSLSERISHQRDFLGKFMVPLFKEFKQKAKKEIYLIMGNDDFRKNADVLEDADKNKILNHVHNKSIKAGKINIAGYGFVNPTPFRLKDWEKIDFDNDKMPFQLFPGQEIRSMEKEEGTIEEDLEELRKLSDPKKTIYVMHAPPFNTKLDVITTGQHVGSKAIRKFIEEEQPLLALHGHIHESPKMSGSWSDKIGKTLCINVGSSYPEDKLNCAVIDANDQESIEYFEL